jgi:sulfotransferase family protein
VSEPAAAQKVVYVLAPARSGTGILGRTLTTIDGVVFSGELRRLWSRGLRPGRTCACGRPHLECPVWSRLLLPGRTYTEPTLEAIGAIQRRAAPEELGWWAAVRRLRTTSAPPPDGDAGRYVRAYEDLLTDVARATGAEVIVDSSKSAADAALLVTAPGLDTYVVEIVRDPRGVAYSVLKRREGGALSRLLVSARIAGRWVLKLLTNGAVRRRFGTERSLFVRYEDLVADPSGTVRSVAALLGIPAPADALAPGVPITVPEVHGPDGNLQQKFVGQTITLRLDETWRDRLPAADRVLITLITFPLLLRHGYGIGRRAARSPQLRT